jgi:phosphohistidine phosphatase SixA
MKSPRAILSTLALSLTLAAAGLARAETIVFLVRHAEKVDASKDPELDERGRARAASLADLLGDSSIAFVYSTDYIRTRETARPVAERLGLPIEIYDPSDLPGLAKRIRAQGGRSLVVGHSNTTGELVRALGGDPGSPIAEDEYDRLYVVAFQDEEDEPTTILLRF